MNCSTRRIRSSGRTSGSIEITLPSELHILEGVSCRLIVRDGVRPEIVLQPDLSMAHAILKDLWEKLRLGLGEIGEISEFSLADYRLSLFPSNHWQFRPPLSFADALSVSSRSGGSPGETSNALSRLLAGLAISAACRLGLAEALALAFGDAVAYLITGVSPSLGTDFERSMAYLAFWENHVMNPLGSPCDDRVWHQVRPKLRRVYEQFHAWQQHPDEYESARDQWYRGLRIEIGTTIPAGES